MFTFLDFCLELIFSYITSLFLHEYSWIQKCNFFALFLYSQYLYLIRFIYLNLSVIYTCIHLNETSIIEHFLLQLPGVMSFRIFCQEYNKTVLNDHDLCKSVFQSTSFDNDYETFLEKKTNVMYWRISGYKTFLYLSNTVTINDVHTISSD